nr:hypothetical protein [Microlunatus elymi]
MKSLSKIRCRSASTPVKMVAQLGPEMVGPASLTRTGARKPASAMASMPGVGSRRSVS